MTGSLRERLGKFACSVACALVVGQGTVVAPSLAVRLTPEEKNTVSVFQKAKEGVVFITNLTNRQDLFTLDLKEIPQGAGSGFVWDDQGHIVTNFHVIKGASDVQITFQDQKVKHGRVVGYDEDRDIAILQVDEEALDAGSRSVEADTVGLGLGPPASIKGDKARGGTNSGAEAQKGGLGGNADGIAKPLPRGSSELLVVGQRVYAIGNPFGLDHTLTQGIVSGLGREITSGTGRPIYDVIQTDAAINPGNSGGPLLDSEGNVVGINTAIYSSTGTSAGVGFAIPIDPINLFVDQILKYGRVTQPILGISFAPDQLVDELGIEGILVLNAIEGGPASKAGMQATTRDSFGRLVLGDIVVGINGTECKNSSDLYRVLNKLAVGDVVSLSIIRGNSKQAIDVTLMDSNTVIPRISLQSALTAEDLGDFGDDEP
ncbi:trypsin-like serine protease [Chloropicon primus]|uniref:Trypsin-like serine protease n=1 Tax=Chloropicon primus TaxID=1764295 RepID=A0A5B8MCG9_9CHLO|nr:trypsin-like serine protease [Chloropicon primus]UPQ97037.1 trypsin-like serine protease [Chloropicon primus]|eukprot:QDZ17821.1 trypsin-like serine protease [Chloropicon primus]